jgi:hypothetical protein
MADETIDFEEWKSAADTVMSAIYGIDTNDAGVGDEWLRNHWTAGEAPRDFVEWFGRKYDLTSKRDIGIEGWL